MTDTSEIARIAAGLGKRQRSVILSLTGEWGRASCHQTAKRMFYGIGKDRLYLVDHKHMSDNCWSLTPLGLAVRAYLEKQG